MVSVVVISLVSVWFRFEIFLKMAPLVNTNYVLFIVLVLLRMKLFSFITFIDKTVLRSGLGIDMLIEKPYLAISVHHLYIVMPVTTKHPFSHIELTSHLTVEVNNSVICQDKHALKHVSSVFSCILWHHILGHVAEMNLLALLYLNFEAQTWHVRPGKIEKEQVSSNLTNRHILSFKRASP